MRTFKPAVLFAFALSLTLSCSRDRVAEPGPIQPSIIGSYSGEYTYLETDNLDQEVLHLTQQVDFRFIDSEFTMVLPESIPESLRVFYDILSTYSSDDDSIVTFDPVPINYFSRPVGLLDETKYPNGQFKYQLTRDSLNMIQEGYATPGYTYEKHLNLRRTGP